MEINKSEQTAGDNSTQVQAGTVNNFYNTTNIVGIDEKRARNICKEEYAIAKANWTQEAQGIAQERVMALEDKLIPKMKQHDETLKIFGDPAFQFVLRKAQISAASRGEEKDLDMLSELIVHRAEQNGNRERTLGITKAIEIIDQIPESSLIGLSIFYAIDRYESKSFDIHQGLKSLDNLYKGIINDTELPVSTQWIENLDVLSAVRMGSSRIQSFKKMEEFLSNQLACLPMGIERNSQEYNEILSELHKVGLYDLKEEIAELNEDNGDNKKILKIEIPLFKEHPLREGFLICTYPPEAFTEGNSINIKVNLGAQELDIPLNREQFLAFKHLSEITYKDGRNVESLTSKLIKEWDNYENLKNVRIWWNQLPIFFTITPIGVAIANAYIRTKYPAIPSMY
ncbi:LPO_1073/Vpar_1526 family protein [Segatella maculosa]|uniref:LPO_1073/Vpar_1526 family protein n=1 Tax=Segatella maculosa TaxID=439703 RepID=UPI0023F0AC2C|nr:LPO_1073/Vpar_1526 family protein [Segatella maculosa]